VKTILITGSSRGIGLALAHEAAKQGYKVILHGRVDSPDLAKAQAAIPESDKVIFDLMKPVEMKREVSRLLDRIGSLDTLINNAGMLVWKTLAEHSDAEIEQALRVNLEAPIKLTKYCLPYLSTGIINIASAAGRDDYDGTWDFEKEVTYSASKFGLRGFSFVLAKECPLLKVVCVNPGEIATEMNEGEGADPAELASKIFESYVAMKAGGSWQELNLFW